MSHKLNRCSASDSVSFFTGTSDVTDYNSDYDSIASENQPILYMLFTKCTYVI